MSDRHRVQGARGLAVAAVLLVITLAGPGTAFAQGADVGELLREGSPSRSFGGAVFGQVGFGQVGEDYYVSVAPGLALHFWRLALGVHAPLRFRVVDHAPYQGGVLRREDWDEPSDFTRILRFVEYGRRDDPLHIRLGELAGASLGYGTIVHHYYNTANINHYKTGLEARMDLHYRGGELLLDNIIDPNLFAVRGFVRPLAFLRTSPVLEQLVFGMTYASDYRAPAHLVRDAAGRTQADSVRRLRARTEVVTLFGLDVGWRFQPHDAVELTPYFDANFLDRLGQGVYAGLLTRLRLPADLALLLRVEYRYATERFSPAYFNSGYEIERYRYRGGEPKIRYLEDLPDGAGRHGFFGEATFVFLGDGSFTIAYEDYEGPSNSSIMLRLRSPWVGPVMAALYYSKRDFGGGKDMFSLDDALLFAEARVRVWQTLFLYGRYARQWHVVPYDEGRGDRFATLDDWDVGVGASWAF